MNINKKQIEDIHDTICIKYNIVKGYLNVGNIVSIIDELDGSFSGMKFYNDNFDKAAALFEGIIRKHPFIDGNKRTALATLQEFLLSNDILFLMPTGAIKFAIVVSGLYNSSESEIIKTKQNIKRQIEENSVKVNESGWTNSLDKILNREIETAEKIQKIARHRSDDKIIPNYTGMYLYSNSKSNLNSYQIIDFLKERHKRIDQFLKNRMKKS